MLHKHSSRIPGLDLIRAIAIVFVVLSHGRWILDDAHPMVQTIFNGSFGYLGVELFFVLSGFLIGGILLKSFDKGKFDKDEVLEFWKRRWYRTLPNYYLVLIINIILTQTLFNDNLPDSLWKFFIFIQNYSEHAGTVFFYDSWSLAVEEHAYLIAPLALIIATFIFPTKSKRKVFLGTVLGLILVVLMSRGIYFYFFSEDITSWNESIRQVVIFRLAAVFIGFLGAYLHYYYQEVWKKIQNPMFIIGVCCVCYCFLFYRNNKYDIHSSFFYIFFPSFYNFSILLLLPKFYYLKIASGLLLKAITFISTISYSLYLLHNSVVSNLMKVMVGDHILSGGTAMLLYVVYWTVSILLSWMLYKYFEKPTTDLRDVDFNKKTTVPGLVITTETILKKEHIEKGE